MTLYLIGTGLRGVKSLGKEALEAIEESTAVFIDTYTSLSPDSTEEFSRKLGKSIIPADRKLIEQDAEEKILKPAKKNNVSVLIHGDPLLATTHFDLLMRAKRMGVETKILHNASIVNAVARTGLHIYKFGKIASIAFPHKDYVPTSHIQVLKQNQSISAHTLFLLDLNLEEHRFLAIEEAVNGLLEAKAIDKGTLCIGCARLGQDDEVIVAGTAAKLKNTDFGKPPYCLIVPGPLHFTEEEALS